MSWKEVIMGKIGEYEETLVAEPLKEPYIRHIKGKIWELRIMVSKGYSRIFYFSYTGKRFVLLHAFLKKTDSRQLRRI